MPTPAFLVRLMAYTRLSRSITIGPEDREALAFAADLRELTLTSRLLCIWTHPANELATAEVRGGKVRVPPRVALAKALGLITGVSDYLFLFRDGSLAIEFKSAKGSLTPGQRDFRDWCALVGVPFYVARSAADALAILDKHGLILPVGERIAA